MAGAGAKAQDTAYKALRSIGVQRGEKSLDHIVSISGRSGQPQPVNWTVLVEDPAARGGLREFDVVGNQVSAERAPVSRANGKPVNLSNLNTDSDGAFNVAEVEARRHHVGFDLVDYTLASDPAAGTPVWTLNLLDAQRRPVGTVRIEADNGRIISGQDWVAGDGSSPPGGRSRAYDADEAYVGGPSTSRPLAPPSSRESLPRGTYSGERTWDDHGHAYVEAPPSRASNRDRDDDDEDGDSHPNEGLVNKAHRYGETVVHFGETVVHKTERAARRVGGWFQKRFTGRDTISPEATDSADNNEATSADPYSQPVQPVPPPQ